MRCQWTPLRALPDGGRAWSVTLTRTDLTQRKATSRALLSEAIESISGGFALFDKNDRLVLCNHMYRSRTFGPGLHVVTGGQFENLRSEERRVGKEWGRTGRYQWWPYH